MNLLEFGRSKNDLHLLTPDWEWLPPGAELALSKERMNRYFSSQNFLNSYNCNKKNKNKNEDNNDKKNTDSARRETKSLTDMAKNNWIISSMTLADIQSIGFFSQSYDDCAFIILSPQLFWFCFHNTLALCVTINVLRLPTYFRRKTRKSFLNPNNDGSHKISYFYENKTKKLSPASVDDSRFLRAIIFVHWYHSFAKLLERIEKEEFGGDWVPEHKLDSVLTKALKLSLCREFSFQSEQVLPPGKYYIQIFPKTVNFKLNSLSEKIRFYFSLVQSKNICAPVSDSTLNLQLHKHHESLCRPLEEVVQPPMEYLDICRELGSQLGERVKQIYDPYVTTLAPQTATFHYSRSKGGVYQDLVDNKVIGRDLSDRHRNEPFVIGLFGPIGSGKTTIVQQLVMKLKEILGFSSNVSYTDLCYSRSPFTEHWDGYHQQPIVVMDDFAQDTKNGLDIAQFIQAVSQNEFIVPMADLSEKGTRFNSQVIILTSNLRFGELIELSPHSTPLLDSSSLWRRIHLPFLIQSVAVSVHPTKHDEIESCRVIKKIIPNFKSVIMESSKYSEESRPSINGNGFRFETIPFILKPSSLIHLLEECRQELNKRMLFFYDSLGLWPQLVHRGKFISEGKGSDVNVRFDPSSCENNNTYYFPVNPPNRKDCKIVGLKEPLKVRVISAGEGVSRCLKPFQIALIQALQMDPTFILTKNLFEHEDGSTEENLQAIEMVMRSLPKPHCLDRYGKTKGQDWRYLSGDYESATDNLPMIVTQSIVEGISQHISHEPTLRWIQWEISSSSMKYPFGTFQQTTGQLMGSILSFPLLCIANKALCQWSGFHEDSYRINGDDLVGTVSKKQEDEWYKKGLLVGLTPSIGKTFSSKIFCTVNSQLYIDTDQRILDTEDPQEGLLHTGKLTLVRREGNNIGTTFRDAQYLYGDSYHLRRLYVLHSHMALRRSPRSLDIPVSHGGLGNLFMTLPQLTFDHNLAKRVYFYDLFNKIFQDCVVIPGTSVSLVPFITVFNTVMEKGSKAQKSFESNFFADGDNLLNQVRRIKQSKECLPEKLQDDDLGILTRSKLNSFWVQNSGKLQSVERFINSRTMIRDYPKLDRFRICYFPFEGKLPENVQFSFLNRFMEFFRRVCKQRDSDWAAFEIFDPYPDMPEWEMMEQDTDILGEVEQTFVPRVLHPVHVYYNHALRLPDRIEVPPYKHFQMCDWSFWDLKHKEMFDGDERW